MVIVNVLWLNPIKAQVDTLYLPAKDSLIQLSHKAIIPFSEIIYCNDTLVSPQAYRLDYSKGRISFVFPQRGKCICQYKTFKHALQDTLALRKYIVRNTAHTDSSAYYLPDSSSGNRRRENLENERSKLESRGSLSRAITVGSATDLAVNSDFRLQLEGMVGNDVEVLAAITDENLPIQPDGTTQQIADFDRVFIQLKKNPFTFTLGDYELKQAGTYYGDFYRNVLGVAATYHKAGSTQVQFAASIAKGKFFSNSFNGENNKQGPYRLIGKNGERFVIILAGSEKIYLNGKLLKRGDDYTIEYNTGEIYFTAKHPLTVNSRIVVDFEYAERNYSRSLLYGRYADSFFKQKLQYALSYGREADDPDAPIDLTISTREKQTLALAGDNPNKALALGADSTRFEATEIRYLKTDTTINGKRYEGIFVYSKDSTRAHYKVLFSYVGPGKGDYRLAPALLNGNVYEWQAPDSLNQPTGEYIAARLVPLPRLLQVFNFSLSYDIHRRIRLYHETGLSLDDANRLSTFDDKDNTALATRTGLKFSRIPMGKNLRLTSDINFRTVGEKYQNFDRVYQMEYGRQWNYNDLGRRLNETVGEVNTELTYKENWRIKTNAGTRTMGDSLFTIKQLYEVQSDDTASLQLLNTFTYLQTQDKKRNANSSWLRNNGDIFKYWKKIRWGSEIWYERKIETIQDQRIDGSFEFIDLKPYIRKTEGKLSFEAVFNYRKDDEFYKAQNRAKSTTYMARVQSNWRPVPHWGTQQTFAYQRFNLKDTAFADLGLNTQESILGNLQTDFATKNRLIQTSFGYQALTERVARRTQVYIQVNPGMGQYQWNDYNDDGIQQLAEFELAANPLTANFVRLLLPSLQLFPAVSLDAQATFRLDFQRVLKDKNSAWAKFFRYFGTLSVLQLQQKRDAALTPSLKDYTVAWEAISDQDTALLSAVRTFRQECYFFKNRPKGDLTFSFIDNQSRQFLISGIELRKNRTYALRFRYTPSTRLSIEIPTQFGSKFTRAELLSSRNFNIQYFSNQLTLLFNISLKLKFSTGYEFKWKENRLETEIRNADLRQHKWINEAKLNFSTKNNLLLRMELFHIQLTGKPNAATSYELLEGMQSGNNAVFNCMLTQYLTRSLELSVVYDGRAAEKRPFIHSARMQLKALF